jgi:hypothetical protein
MAGMSTARGGATSGGPGGGNAGVAESASGGAPAGEAGATAGGGEAGTGDLFTNPLVPHCDEGASQYHVRGTLAGKQLDVMTAGDPGDLYTYSFQILAPGDGVHRVTPNTLLLTWTEPVHESASVPLTGATLLVPEGQPLAGESYCITEGEFGSPAHDPSDGWRTLLFSITGARSGDCSGPAVDIALGGCVVRPNSYFPGASSPAYEADPSRPSIDASTLLTDLTPDEQGELCDWWALELGGYGTVTDCIPVGGGGTELTIPSQALCISGILGEACPGDTVGAFITCTLAEVPTRGCEYPGDQCQVLGCLH